VAELIAPTTRLHSSWLNAHAEWGPGFHEDGFGLLPTDETVSLTGFSRWVSRLASESELTNDATASGCIYRWIVDGDRVLGGIALRYCDSEFIRSAGHIGYGIAPSARRRGLATWALNRILTEARILGLDRVLLVCAAHNVASAAMIERNGGLFDGVGDTEHGPTRRYWISTVQPIEKRVRSSAGDTSEVN
jgi:predicted acetyltransferase